MNAVSNTTLLTSADLRCIAHPDLMPLVLDQFDKPLAVARRLHANQHPRRQWRIKHFGFSPIMHQLLLPLFPGLRVPPTPLLPARMKITPLYLVYICPIFLPCG